MEIVNQTRPVVEIYGTKVCPYCVQAKRLVGQKDWELKEYKVDERTELREEMEKRAGQPVRTVPQNICQWWLYWWLLPISLNSLITQN